MTAPADRIPVPRDPVQAREQLPIFRARVTVLTRRYAALGEELERAMNDLLACELTASGQLDETLYEYGAAGLRKVERVQRPVWSRGQHGPFGWTS